MSKPVPNVEIEDVLSSIRRLVSTSDRVERAAPEAEAGATDKLVLTPSLRIDDTVGKGASSAEEAPEEQGDTSGISEDSRSDDEVSERASVESAAEQALEHGDEFLAFVKETDVPEDGQAEASSDAEPSADDALQEPEGSLSEGIDGDPDVEEEVSATDASDDDADGDLTLDLAESPEFEDQMPDQDTANNLQRRAAEFEAIVAKTVDQWDPDGTTQDENAAVSGGPVPWQDEDDQAPNDATVIDDPLSIFDQDEQMAADEPSEGMLSGGATAAEASSETEAPENPVAEEVSDAVDAELCDDEVDESAAPPNEALLLDAESMPFEFRSHATAALQGALNASVERELGEAALAKEEALLDEEMLRDMVSDIVRQELQGALGERITRNVRKLVRREIHRALASRELD